MCSAAETTTTDAPGSPEALQMSCLVFSLQAAPTLADCSPRVPSSCQVLETSLQFYDWNCLITLRTLGTGIFGHSCPGVGSPINGEEKHGDALHADRHIYVVDYVGASFRELIMVIKKKIQVVSCYFVVNALDVFDIILGRFFCITLY